MKTGWDAILQLETLSCEFEQIVAMVNSVHDAIQFGDDASNYAPALMLLSDVINEKKETMDNCANILSDEIRGKLKVPKAS